MKEMVSKGTIAMELFAGCFLIFMGVLQFILIRSFAWTFSLGILIFFLLFGGFILIIALGSLGVFDILFEDVEKPS